MKFKIPFLIPLFLILLSLLCASAHAEEDSSVIISPLGVSEKTKTRWVKALEKHGVTGTTFIGTIPGNGYADKKHPRGHRDAIVFAPSTIDYKKPVEFVFFFHGLEGFGEHDFDVRLARNIKTLMNDKNFILIFPEMPWSQNTSTPRSRQNKAWVGAKPYEDLNLFSECALVAIYRYFSSELFEHPNTVTLIGHSAGGGALKQAALSGSLDFVQPTKIIFSDADYNDYTKTVWEKYVKDHPECNLKILVRDGDKPYKKTVSFLKRFSGKIPENIDFITLSRKFSHKKIGDQILLWIK